MVEKSAQNQDLKQSDADSVENTLQQHKQSNVSSRYNMTNQLSKFEKALDSSFDREDLK